MITEVLFEDRVLVEEEFFKGDEAFVKEDGSEVVLVEEILDVELIDVELKGLDLEKCVPFVTYDCAKLVLDVVEALKSGLESTLLNQS